MGPLSASGNANARDTCVRTEASCSTSAYWRVQWRKTFVAALLLLSGLSSDGSLAKYKKSELPYPAGSDITSQWIYSCPSRRCAFSCPGAGGASHVTKLTIFMGRMRIGSDQNPFAMNIPQNTFRAGMASTSTLD